MEGFSAQPGPVRGVILVKAGPEHLSGECFRRGSKPKQKNRSKKQCNVFKELKEMRILEASKMGRALRGKAGNGFLGCIKEGLCTCSGV